MIKATSTGRLFLTVFLFMGIVHTSTSYAQLQASILDTQIEVRGKEAAQKNEAVS